MSLARRLLLRFRRRRPLDQPHRTGRADRTPAASIDASEDPSRLFRTDPATYFLTARGLAEQGLLAEVLYSLDRLLEIHPQNTQLLSFARSTALRHAGPDCAVKYALRLSEYQPNDLKNEIMLADWDVAAGKADAALRRMNALLSADPNADRAIIRKGRALVALGRGGEAWDVLSHAVKRGSDDVKLLSFARNVASENGGLAAARDIGLKIESLAPDDQKNATSLVQSFLLLGEFDEALRRADALIAAFPHDLSAQMLRAQILVALHRAGEALQVLKDALAQHGDEPRLLALLRATAFQNGCFDEAVRYASRLRNLGATGVYDTVLLIHSYVAAGQYDEVRQLVGPKKATPTQAPLQKEHHHFWALQRLKKSAPAMVAAWELALQNRLSDSQPESPDPSDLGATMIQYWSQGTPPPDVQIVCDNWARLFREEKLGQIKLFDRVTAEAWIGENAPEFAPHFSQSFHYAMESDIFRIAYASKQPCIYMDIDSWPLDHTASILRFAVESKSTMLYARAYRAWIVNGFFVSTPESLFVKELARQCLAVDLTHLPKTYAVLESSFGPSRYSKVLMDLLAAEPAASACKVEKVTGCSVIKFGQSEVYVTHDAAVASVRPPFPLGYKATDDYWKFFSLPAEA